MDKHCSSCLYFKNKGSQEIERLYHCIDGLISKVLETGAEIRTDLKFSSPIERAKADVKINLYKVYDLLFETRESIVKYWNEQRELEKIMEKDQCEVS